MRQGRPTLPLSPGSGHLPQRCPQAPGLPHTPDPDAPAALGEDTGPHPGFSLIQGREETRSLPQKFPLERQTEQVHPGRERQVEDNAHGPEIDRLMACRGWTRPACNVLTPISW